MGSRRGESREEAGMQVLLEGHQAQCPPLSRQREQVCQRQHQAAGSWWAVVGFIGVVGGSIFDGDERVGWLGCAGGGGGEMM